MGSNVSRPRIEPGTSRVRVAGSTTVLVSPMLVGSQECYNYYCQPCDVDNNQVEATFYCSNCEEYLCRKCSTSHKKFKQLSDHDVLDIQNMDIKPPVSKKRSRDSSGPIKSGHSTPANPAPASTVAVTIVTTSRPGTSRLSTSANPASHSTAVVTTTTSGPGKSGHDTSANPAPASTEAVTLTHVRDINIGVTYRTSSITCIGFAVICAGQLLAAAYLNNKVMLVGFGGLVLSKMTLPGKPRQVTRISDTEAAVTLPDDNKIVLLRTEPQLSVVREISVRGACSGIAYMDNSLIVTFVASRVDILSMSGKVLRTIYADRFGQRIFIRPRYVAVDPKTGSMYVSDYVGREGGRLVKLSKEGSVEATYTNYRMDIMWPIYRTARECWPCQVVLDNQGMVYVAWEGKSRESGWVEQLDANCKHVSTIAFLWASKPWGLSYDEVTQQLYVGDGNGVVKVYKLS